MQPTLKYFPTEQCEYTVLPMFSRLHTSCIHFWHWGKGMLLGGAGNGSPENTGLYSSPMAPPTQAVSHSHSSKWAKIGIPYILTFCCCCFFTSGAGIFSWNVCSISLVKDLFIIIACFSSWASGPLRNFSSKFVVVPLNLFEQNGNFTLYFHLLLSLTNIISHITFIQ